MLALALALAPVVACDQYLSKTFPADKPGAAVAVVRAGRPVLVKGYGLADVAKRTPITRRTAFDLASVSKPFTALAVALLIDRGKLAPDDDVRKWLPTVPCLDPKRPVRVRDLLQHTSGLPHCYRLPGLSPFGPDFGRRTNADVLAAVAEAKPLRPPGRAGPAEPMEYNNTNYVLLAELVRAADGRPLGRFLADEVFAPLGMTDTRVADAVPVRVPDRAQGYREGRPVQQDAAIHGDGNVFSTLDDLVKWDAALTAGRVLKPATWTAAWTPGKLDDGTPLDYGWGWTVVGGVQQHGGRWGGYRTLVTRVPKVRFSLVVLSNEETTKVIDVQEELFRRVMAP
jgi:D-alanyl-D-alanine carboxypeptidase